MRNRTFIAFCLKVIVFVLLLFLVDRGIGSVFVAMKDHGLKINSENMWLKTAFVVEKVDAEVLIIGSSKASHHYVPAIIADSLQMTVYNCGQDGCFFLYQNCIINMVLDRYKPQMIFWDLQPECFSRGDNMQEYQNLRYLSPYYGKNHWVTMYVNGEGKTMSIKMCSKMFAYNSKIFNYVFPLLAKSSKTERGYIPLPVDGYDYPVLARDFNDTSTYFLCDDKFKLLDRTMERCQIEGVKLNLFVSPKYDIKSEAYNQALQGIQCMAQKYDIEYLDCSSNSIFMNDATLFKDVSHLNDKGARVFTEFILRKIR